MTRLKGLRLTWAVSAAALAVAVAGPVAATSPVISGTIAAVRSTDPGFVGMWKYCIDLAWDVTGYGGQPHGLSHASLLPGLDSCVYICRPGYFAFADTIGFSVGSGAGACTTYYHGRFNCKGDPTLPVKSAAIKLEPNEGSTCRPGTSGTARFCFYSPAAPRPAGTYPDALWIKFGQNTASGPLVGTLPDCGNPSTSVQPTTWGAIKALLHR
jgi:hypothetical protein